jgi:hypothetical protein
VYRDFFKNTDYSNYLEKGADGNYYDKDTGKSYDSEETWAKAQETLAKRYESTATHYEKKVQKEWAGKGRSTLKVGRLYLCVHWRATFGCRKILLAV